MRIDILVHLSYLPVFDYGDEINTIISNQDAIIDLCVKILSNIAIINFLVKSFIHNWKDARINQSNTFSKSLMNRMSRSLTWNDLKKNIITI